MPQRALWRAAGSPAKALYSNVCPKTLFVSDRGYFPQRRVGRLQYVHILQLLQSKSLSYQQRWAWATAPGCWGMELKSSHICQLCNRVATSGRLREPVCGISSTCSSQILPISLLRLCITSLQLQQNCLDNYTSPQVHRKARGTTGSKGNLPLIRRERSCWRLSEGIVRPWAMLAEAAVVSLVMCLCCCHIPESVQAPCAHLCRAAVQHQCNSRWSCISLQNCQTSGKATDGKIKEKPSFIYF